jgi:DNA-directed RNA polymerase alpha subunit
MTKKELFKEQSAALVKEFNEAHVLTFEELEIKVRKFSLRVSEMRKDPFINELTPVVDTHLCGRTLNIISAHLRKSYRDPWPTLLQLSEVSEKGLLKWKGAGKKTVQEINHVLSMVGLSLKPLKNSRSSEVKATVDPLLRTATGSVLVEFSSHIMEAFGCVVYQGLV